MTDEPMSKSKMRRMALQAPDAKMVLADASPEECHKCGAPMRAEFNILELHTV